MDSNQLIIEALNKLVININELNEEMHAMKQVTTSMTIEQVEIDHQLRDIKSVLINDNLIG